MTDMKGLDFMEITMTKKGWVNTETDDFTPFGDLAVDCYNLTKIEMEHINMRLYHDLHIKGFPSFISGRNTPDCNSQKQIFASDEEIIGIIWSEKFLHDPCDRQYVFDGKNDYYNGMNVYYIPLYEDYLLNLFNGNKHYVEYLKVYQQNKKFMNLIEFLCNYEDRPFYTDEEFYDLTMRILESWIYPLEINTVLRKYKNSYCRAYIVKDIHWLIYDDILQMIDFKYNLDFCPICGKAFVKRDKRRNFCNECACDEKKKKKYNDQKRKDDLRYLHKITTDMLRNRQEDYSPFVEESHYYADLVSGKDIEYNPKYDPTIKTESDYRKWLEKKHKEYMVRQK